MKPRVYGETSVISYLTARPSRDLIVAAHQELTRQWWGSAAEHFELVVSEFVYEEARKGDAVAANERLNTLRELTEIDVSEDCQRLAGALLTKGALPQHALYDALHVAVCAIQSIDILVTWNCKHIANVTMYGVIEATCREYGLTAPRICTPVELWGMKC